jgi:hypothetical protein
MPPVAPNPLIDGDQGFIGLNSRDNPQILQKGQVTKSVNMRLNRGVATVRKGLKRLTPGGLSGVTLRHVTTFRNSVGQDLVILIASNAIYTYNTVTAAVVGPILFEGVGVGTIDETDEVDAFQAGGNLFILRGFNKHPLKWIQGAASVLLAPPTSGGNIFPNSPHGIYSNNRIILKSSPDEISVSHYLEYTRFNLLDVFKINDGSNDEIVAIAPWVLNEFVVFMRNRMYYASVGAGAYNQGDAPISDDSYVKVLATDIGCIARKTIAQAAGGMMFLSDFGVYMMQPQNATTPEGMRAGVMGEPISAPIDDVILRINQNAVKDACAIYFDNRYYLAVPLDGSTRNNAVLVYNFINKAWESVDTFQSGMDVSFMITGLYNNRKRLFYVDKDYGIFLSEENEYGDEFDDGTTNNVLPFPLPFTLANSISFTRYKVNGELITRSYNMGQSEDKRYSSVEIDLNTTGGAIISSYAITENPDITHLLEVFGSPENEDGTRDLPIRKVAASCFIRLTSENGRPTIRSITVNANSIGSNTRSTK